MISAINDSADFGPWPEISQPEAVDSTPNAFMAILDQITSKDAGVSPKDAGKMVQDLLAWISTPPLTPQVAPQPAAPGVFGVNEEYQKNVNFSMEPMEEALLG